MRGKIPCREKMEAAIFVNCTPHALTMNDGTVIPVSGTVARVTASFSDFNADGICEQTFGEIQDLPQPKEGTYYIVSALVLAAAKASGRTDVVAPATGHPDCVRNQGMIVSVPGFVR